MRILVTGANGFLGRHVVQALCRRGHSVLALDRQPADVASLGWQGLSVEQVNADLCDGALASMLGGADAVIHLAAQLRGEPQETIRNTVEGTRKLIAAMETAAIKRLVLASSFSVYDWSRIEVELNEESPLESRPEQRDAYAVAKIKQEELVRGLTAERGWSLTVLRPGALWGKGLEYPAIIGQRVGPLHLVFGPDRTLPLTHVENCADVFSLVVDHPAAVGEAFNVVDGEGPQAWEFAGQYLRRSGRRDVRVPVAYGLANGIAQAVHPLLHRVLRGRTPSILVSHRFEARFKPLRFSNRKLVERLGWRPPLGYEECLVRTYGR